MAAGAKLEAKQQQAEQARFNRLVNELTTVEPLQRPPWGQRKVAVVEIRVHRLQVTVAFQCKFVMLFHILRFLHVLLLMLGSEGSRKTHHRPDSLSWN